MEREIWLRYRKQRWQIRRLEAVHWKGSLLLMSPVALIPVIWLVYAWHLPMPALYWLGVLVFVAIYWMLLLDHTQWE